MSTEIGTFKPILWIHPHDGVYVYYVDTLLLSTTGSSRLRKTNPVMNEEKIKVVSLIA